MNPDACRDMMDRSRIPYEGIQDASKGASDLDQLSIKKQLPLRQQTNRPMFKYNTSITRSVHLFHPGEVGMQGQISKDAANVNHYSLTGIYYTGLINGTSTPIVKPPIDSNYNLVKNLASQQINNHNSTQPTQKPANPYVRPVSATEVAANINGEKAKRMIQSTVEAVSDKTFPDSKNQSLQRNSFLRPLSGVSQSGKDKVPDRKQQEPSHYIRQNSAGSDSSIKQYSESKIEMKNKFQFASTAPSVPASHVPTSVQASNSSTFKTQQNKATQGSNSSTIHNQTYSPNKPYVNNPFKSYEQIKAEPTTPYVGHTNKVINHVKSVLDETRSSQNFKSTNAGESFLGGHTSSAGLDTHSEPGTLKKMPVTNTLTGTLYYRKTSLGGAAPKTTVEPAQNLSIPNHVVGSNQNPEPVARPRNPTPSKPPTGRPAFERSNASLQLQSKIQESKGKTAPPTAPTSKPVVEQSTKNNKSSISKSTSLGTMKPLQRDDFSSKPIHRSDLKKHHRKSILVEKVSAPEKRSIGDGAPSKALQYAERKNGVKGSPWDDQADDDNYTNDGSEAPDDDEDDNDDEDEEGDNTPSGERYPGDGEASDEDYCDEDALDQFEESVSGDDSDGFSINSKSSGQLSHQSSVSRPNTAHSQTGKKSSFELKNYARPLTASGTVVIKPALRNSLFPRIPPTLNFVSEGEKTETLPWEFRKLLKWKMSPITPIVVKRAIARVGFRISKRNHDWLGCFGKHMKANCFKSLREYQKLNHFPGSFQIGRKDRLWRNLSRMQVHFGKKEFNFFPHTYVLPADLKQLKRAWEDGNSKQKWIIKPPASARGIGIRVISKWSQIPRRKPVIVQKYLSRPYLINDSKFDMRVYVYVSSYDPLRVYVYEDGLARFASCKYSTSMKSLNNRYMHLTNYSVNKKNSDYLNNGDNTICQGHKWSLKALWTFMKRQGINTTLIWDSIRDLIIKTIICGDGPINSMTKSNVRSRYTCHELFGFDILLDEHLKPWILEVNISPSLHSNSQLDINIKGGMIKDLLNLSGFRLPDDKDLSASASSSDMSSHSPSNKFCMDKRLFTNQLAPDERAKHAYYVQKHQDEQIMQSILDVITPDDIRHLCESIDEDSRKGNFQRLFPTPHTHRYLRYFEQPRYYNLLLDQWVLRYNRMEQRGILLLQSFCEEGIHLENPTMNSKHQWAPPNSTVANIRAHEVSRPIGTQNSARGSAPVVGVLPRTLKKLPVKPGQNLSHSSSNNSVHSMGSSPHIHTPSPIGPIASPSR